MRCAVCGCVIPSLILSVSGGYDRDSAVAVLISWREVTNAEGRGWARRRRRLSTDLERSASIP